jgi:hypothetical protein
VTLGILAGPLAAGLHKMVAGRVRDGKAPKWGGVFGRLQRFWTPRRSPLLLAIGLADHDRGRHPTGGVWLVFRSWSTAAWASAGARRELTWCTRLGSGSFHLGRPAHGPHPIGGPAIS